MQIHASHRVGSTPATRTTFLALPPIQNGCFPCFVLMDSPVQMRVRAFKKGLCQCAGKAFAPFSS
jgi:hypothetical protein